MVLSAAMRSAPPRTVVEIGSYLGRSTVFFALALRQLNPGGRVVAIDPHTGDRQQLEGLPAERLPTFELFRQHCCAVGVDKVVEACAARPLEVAADWSEPGDLLYVDGWHSYDTVVADGEAWLPQLSSRGVVVFDDYVAYGEVREATHDLGTRGLFRLRAIAGRGASQQAIQRAEKVTRGRTGCDGRLPMRRARDRARLYSRCADGRKPAG